MPTMRFVQLQNAVHQEHRVAWEESCESRRYRVQARDTTIITSGYYRVTRLCALLRWLLPVAIPDLGFVGYLYWLKLQEPIAEKPPFLPPNVKASAMKYCVDQAQGANPKMKICAASMSTDGTVTELHGVELQPFHVKAEEYNLVTSDFAKFNGGTQAGLRGQRRDRVDSASGRRGSGETAEDAALASTFPVRAGEASTSRPVLFDFDRGRGSAVGAGTTRRRAS